MRLPACGRFATRVSLSFCCRNNQIRRFWFHRPTSKVAAGAFSSRVITSCDVAAASPRRQRGCSSVDRWPGTNPRTLRRPTPPHSSLGRCTNDRRRISDSAHAFGEPQNSLLPSRRCARTHRSEEHTSDLKSLIRTSYVVLCLKKNTHT